MSILERLLYLIGLRPNPGPRYYEINESLQTSLKTLAQYEGRPEHELATDLMAAGLTHYYSTDELWKRWQTLSRRERDVAALACLGNTNRQIAARLGISPETVKTHLGNALIKFNIHTRYELAMLLGEWDFSGWNQ
jgi:DNA-binding CsgD family transcriptional regulator